MTRLLLASASPARAAILRGAGIDPLVTVSQVDESAVLAGMLAAALRAGESAPDAAAQVLALAAAKARDVATRLPGVANHPLVLGCDSMLEMDDGGGAVIVGKPADADTARRRWRSMRGTTGLLHTGHWLIDTARDPGHPLAQRGATSTTRVRFAADVTDEEIDAYVATGEPLRVAGAFTLDGLGGPFVEGVEGDHHGVIGLSLPLLRRLLRESGRSITELWAAR